MDNYYAINVVLQMAKAWRNMQDDMGYLPSIEDDEAIVAVEELLKQVEEEAA